MKRILPFFLAVIGGVAAFGETIRIGTMELPLCFEGEAPTGNVYEWAFEPICLMEMSRQPLGTNEVWFLPVRTDQPNEQGYSRDIFPLRLVFFEGIWSLLH